jgi:hypothetical protein
MKMEVKWGNKATSRQHTKRIEGKNFGDSSDCTSGNVGSKGNVFFHDSDIRIKAFETLSNQFFVSPSLSSVSVVNKMYHNF